MSPTKSTGASAELGPRDPPAEGLAREPLERLLIASLRAHAIIMVDPGGRVVLWSDGAEGLTGYPRAEILGHDLSRLYPDADRRARTCERGRDVAAREGRCDEEGWRVRKDGSRIWVGGVTHAARDERGALVGFSYVWQDLTARKRADDQQAARLAAEERYRVLIESVRDYAIFMLDASGRVATWNPGAQRIKGYTAEEIIGRHFSAFYPEHEVRAGTCERELEVAAREGRFEDEGWRVRKDGSQFWANVVISAVRDDAGTLLGFTKVTRDLTERKQAEEERAARLAAERANRTKDEFLAMLGHELRNPLAPIVTALQLMKLRGDGEASKEQLVIERQVKHMMLLVDDLLDVSRIARGKVEIRKQHVDLRGVLAKAIEIASPLFEQRNHHFELRGASESIVLDGDEARLTQIFANLMTNAAKYTDPGGHIVLAVSVAEGTVTVTVSDDGIGIEPALLPRVFELFVQGYQGAQRAAGGLGLGLTLVKNLVELHGGTVEASSPGRGGGSTFTVRLPILEHPREEAPRSAPRSAQMAAGTGQRVLIVDDNEDARMLLADILERVGHDVRAVGDPVEALHVVDEFLPDVAVLDIGLPVMDGFELAAHLRAKPGGAACRMIALTGYGQAHDRERSAHAGFAAHLVKPVDLQQLIDAIRPAGAEPAPARR